MNPALKYRTQIADSILSSHLPLEGMEDGTLYAELDRIYRDIKQSRLDTDEPSLGLFVISVGLFAYGRLDVLRDVVTNYDDNSNAKSLIRSIGELLPVTFGDFQKVEEWIKLNQHKLVWDEKEGKSFW